jgi:uncharacterized protein
MTTNFVLLGCPYPILETPKGYLPSQQGVAQIKSDLLSLLQTFPKERVMTPEFGTDLRPLFFEIADNTLIATAQSAVIAALAAWEPRIAVQSVVATVNDNVLTISIEFIDPQNINNIEVLTLELPVGGSSNNF